MSRATARRDKGRGKHERQKASRKVAAADAELLRALELLEERRAPYQELLQGIIANTLERFPLEADTPIVEIGAGAGQLGQWLPHSLAARTLHTDPSERALRMLRQRDAKANTRNASAENLPFGPATVGGVLGLCVFDAISDEAAVVREAARVLRTGGRFVHFLDMAMLLDAPFAKLAENGLVPIPNVLSDPAEHEWPLDILLIRRDWLLGLLEISKRTAHPFFATFQDYFRAFFAPRFDMSEATTQFKGLGSNSERRNAFMTLLRSACHLAAAEGYPALELLPFHSGRYLLSMLTTSFGQSQDFTVELADIETRSIWRKPPAGSVVRYRSLCLGHQRIWDELPSHLLTESAKARLAAEGPPKDEMLIEAGVFAFVARRV
jgi:ubiquinone/menaquinone biosynthesis C-methylase UbiE